MDVACFRFCWVELLWNNSIPVGWRIFPLNWFKTGCTCEGLQILLLFHVCIQIPRILLLKDQNRPLLWRNLNRSLLFLFFLFRTSSPRSNNSLNTLQFLFISHRHRWLYPQNLRLNCFSCVNLNACFHQEFGYRVEYILLTKIIMLHIRRQHQSWWSSTPLVQLYRMLRRY